MKSTASEPGLRAINFNFNLACAGKALRLNPSRAGKAAN